MERHTKIIFSWSDVLKKIPNCHKLKGGGGGKALMALLLRKELIFLQLPERRLSFYLGPEGAKWSWRSAAKYFSTPCG